jgi:YbbR domain-containing protein
MRHWLLDDLGWRILCLASAVLLWLIFSGTQQLSTSIAAPVQYRNIPRNLEISSDMVEQVHLHLRGASSQLSRLAPSALPIIIDLAGTKSTGDRTFTLNAGNLSLPSGVTLERAIPGQIRVRLENRAWREVPVVARLQGLPPGWRILKQEIAPAELNIVGPESRVVRIQRVETDPIDLSTASAGEAEWAVHVFSGDPQVNFASQPIVKVRVTLAAGTD